MTIKTASEINAFQRRVKRKLSELEREKSSNSSFRVPKVKEDAQCVIDTKDLLDELFNTILTYDQEYGLKWMKGLEHYISDKKIYKTYANFTRGNIVMVELFGHYNSELTFEHPAVILHDNKNSMLVAPVSTSKHKDKEELHIDVDQSNGFHHPCAILLDSIRVIDKRRITMVYTKDGSNTNIGPGKLDEIDKILIENYAPELSKEHENLRVELERIKKINQELNDQHEKVKKELENQTVLYNQAKDDLQKLLEQSRGTKKLLKNEIEIS